jgi:hypothetical protein
VSSHLNLTVDLPQSDDGQWRNTNPDSHPTDGFRSMLITRDLLVDRGFYRERAAAKIQAAYRGYTVRKSLSVVHDKCMSLQRNLHLRVTSTIHQRLYDFVSLLRHSRKDMSVTRSVSILQKHRRESYLTVTRISRDRRHRRMYLRPCLEK